MESTIMAVRSSQVIKPNTSNQKNFFPIKVFLAGSIEMGKAEDWQTRVENLLDKDQVTIYNPRREDWDSSWSQEETNDNFRYQVNWEMNRLEMSNFILMNFDPETKSPITLFELGLHCKDQKLVICCPKEFWRSGNVQVICSRYNIPLFERLEDAVACIQTKIESLSLVKFN